MQTQTGNRFCLLTAYPIPANGNEAALVEGILALSRSCWIADGYMGTHIFRHKSNTQIFTISQWTSEADYELAFQAANRQKLRNSLTGELGVDAQPFELLAVDGR